MRNNSINAVVLLGSLVTIGAQHVAASRSAAESPIEPGFQAAYRYINNYPYDEEAGHYYHELNGITHDNDYWYFTSNQFGSYMTTSYLLRDSSIIWKYPVQCDLKKVPNDTSPAICKSYPIRYSTSDYSQLKNLSCNHFGDIAYYNSDGKGYILLSLEGCTGGGRIAFLRSSSLKLVDTMSVQAEQGNKAPWVAVDRNTGRIYSSRYSSVTTINVFEIDWDYLNKNGRVQKLSSSIRTLSNTVKKFQGGDFSDDGTLFYAAGGDSGKDSGDKRVHVFETSGTYWSRLKRSSQSSRPFKFQAEYGDEPEGVTYWNLNNGRAPGVQGEVHVILLNNDADKDNAYIKHYTSIIETSPEEGLGHAVYNKWDGHGAWDGAVIALGPGRYREQVHIDSMHDGKKRNLKIVAIGGVARVAP